PVRAAVRRPEDAALLLRSVRRAERARHDDLRICRIDDDAADAAGLLEAAQRPRLAGVGGFVDPAADRNMAADPRFTRSGPDEVRIGGCDGERTDRLYRLVIEDLRPVDAAVDAFRDAAGRAACVVDERIARHADDCRDSVPFRPDVAPAKVAVDLR